MARWITFDSDASEYLRSQLPRETIVVRAGSALQAALDDPSDSVLLMPSQNPGSAVLVRLHRNAARANEPRFEATGFLGLMDEPVYDDEPQPEQKKSWWKKVF